MKSKGNGTPQQCVENLLRITRGEVPYERLKGLDGQYIDRPGRVSTQLMADADWMLRNYEPRADVRDIELVCEEEQNGLYAIHVDTAVRGVNLVGGE